MATPDPLKPLIFATVFYNGALMSGFVNYIAGLGCAFWVLALWQRATPFSVDRFILAIGGSVLVFCVHVIAAFFLVAAIGLLELELICRSRDYRVRSLVHQTSGLTAGFVILLLLTLSPTGHAIVSTDGTHHIVYIGAPGFFGIINSKLTLLVHPLIDGSGFRGAVIMMAGLLGLSYLTARAMHLGLLRPGLYLALGLNALWLAAPFRIGDGFFLDYRLVPPAVIVTIAATQIQWQSLKVQQWVMTAALLFSVCRSLSLIDDIRRYARTYSSFEQAIGVIAPDSVLLTAIGTGREAISWTTLWSPQTEHLATLAVQRGVFVPTTFALPSQQAIVLQPQYREWRSRSYLADDAHVARTWPLFDKVCAVWQTSCHTGGVYLAVVYPSDYSDGLFRRAAVKWRDTKFQLIELCGE